MTWLLRSIVDGIISYWAYKQVKLMIQTYKDINSLEQLRNESDNPDSKV